MSCQVNHVDCRKTSQIASLQVWPDVAFFSFWQEPCCALSTRALQRSTLTKKADKFLVSNMLASVTGPCYHLQRPDCFFWRLKALDMFLPCDEKTPLERKCFFLHSIFLITLFQWPCFWVDFYSGTSVIRLLAYDEFSTKTWRVSKNIGSKALNRPSGNSSWTHNLLVWVSACCLWIKWNLERC